MKALDKVAAHCLRAGSSLSLRLLPDGAWTATCDEGQGNGADVEQACEALLVELRTRYAAVAEFRIRALAETKAVLEWL
jgi:hypothetical protein